MNEIAYITPLGTFDTWDDAVDACARADYDPCECITVERREYVAVALKRSHQPDGQARILEVCSSEAASLDALSYWANKGEHVFRRCVPSDVFVRWSNGEHLSFSGDSVVPSWGKRTSSRPSGTFDTCMVDGQRLSFQIRVF